MYTRQLAAEIQEAANAYPIVTVTGPRQSGKTTLVRALFPDKPYANLEFVDMRAVAEEDPRSFLAQFPEGAILDEIQNVPSLLSYIQPLVDERRQNGLYVLTGSHTLNVHNVVSQSLAGRTALLSLLPMSLTELNDAHLSGSLDETLLRGGYPRIYTEDRSPTKVYREYVQTYLERDLRDLIHVKDLIQFQRFMRLCAGRIGQLVNLRSLSNDTGVSEKTITHWLSILEASFVIVRLQPFHNNLGKRLVKSPKLYFTDVGVASYLLGIETSTQMARDPLRGHLFENLVLLELMKARLNQGHDPRLYFYRDAHGHEVDFIHTQAHDLIPIEVKAAGTFNRDFLKGLKHFKKVAGNRCANSFLVYAGEQEWAAEGVHLRNYQRCATIVSLPD